MPSRVISYIDGYNLYFGLREKAYRRDANGQLVPTNWRKYMWLDVVGLSRSLLRSDQILVATKYFTARIRGHPAREARQSKFIDAISTLPDISLYYGVFRPDPKQCQHCGQTAYHPQEKRTDVNIANQMICDAVFDRFEVALLVSADSDQVPTVKTVKDIFHKQVFVAFPPCRDSTDLAGVADAVYRIGKSKFEANVMPKTIQLPSGVQIGCPGEWRLPDEAR